MHAFRPWVARPTRRRTLAGRLPAAGLALLVLVLAGAAACEPAAPSPSPRTPTVIGVIREVEFLGSRQARITLEIGQQVEIDLASADVLYGGGPKVGDLLLYGVDAGGPWLAELPPAGDEFRITSPEVGWGPGPTITFPESGLRLRFAPGYSEGPGAFEAGMPVTYFVNERGELVRRS